MRKEITEPEAALGGERDEELEEVELRDDLPFDARLFVRRPPTGHPWWETFLARGTAARFTIPVRNAGAILFVRAQKHLFAFTFGTGRFSLDPSSYERDFGLRVALNAVDLFEKLRLRRWYYHHYSPWSDESHAGASSLNEFAADRDSTNAFNIGPHGRSPWFDLLPTAEFGVQIVAQARRIYRQSHRSEVQDLWRDVQQTFSRLKR